MKHRLMSVVVVFWLFGLWGCGGDKKKAAETDAYMVVGEYVAEEDSFPRLRYFETNQVSLNDRCAVRRTRLNPKMPPIYVNGQPVGFC